jgi:aminocarboxymuconate-semialdehyde decarboxylase
MTAHVDTCPCAVDVHVHAVPRPLLDDVAAGTFPGIDLLREGSSPVLRFPEMAPSPPVPEAMTDGRALREAEGQRHVTTQLLGPWTDLFGYTLPAGVAADWSRAYNEALAAEAARTSGQHPMATIPLAHPPRAVEELEAARAMGCRGVMIGTDIPGFNLGSPELEPVWEAAAELGLPVLLHPTHLRVPPALENAGLKNAVGRAGPTAIALTHLLYSGALLRHPRLSFIACHGGGAFATVAPRVVRNHDLGWSGTDTDVRESIARLYFDSVVLDPGLLRYLVSVFGAGRFLLGSDLPFPWEQNPVGTVLAADLPRPDQAAVLGDTARRLYGIGPDEPCRECAAVQG